MEGFTGEMEGKSHILTTVHRMCLMPRWTCTPSRVSIASRAAHPLTTTGHPSFYLSSWSSSVVWVREQYSACYLRGKPYLTRTLWSYTLFTIRVSQQWEVYY
jgi:hypothetical protein